MLSGDSVIEANVIHATDKLLDMHDNDKDESTPNEQAVHSQSFKSQTLTLPNSNLVDEFAGLFAN